MVADMKPGSNGAEKVMTTNEKVIAWITERLEIPSREEIPWTPTTEEWIHTASRHGNDAPPDVLPVEVAVRLSEIGDKFSMVPHEGSEP